MSGKVYTSPAPENKVCSLESQVKNKLQRTSDEMLPMILELIHVGNHPPGPISSVIYQKLLSGQPIVCQTSNEKYVLRLSLGLFRLP